MTTGDKSYPIWKDPWVNKFKEYQNIELTMFWALFLLRGIRANAKLNVYQNMHDSLVFITEMIRESKYQDEEIEEYLWIYLNNDFIMNLSDERLTEFSNRLLKYYENLRRKKLNLDYHFSDDDWFDLVDILDDYEE